MLNKPILGLRSAGFDEVYATDILSKSENLKPLCLTQASRCMFTAAKVAIKALSMVLLPP